MRLFIWVDPYHVSYGSSLAFAVAATVEEARAQLKTADACQYGIVTPGLSRSDVKLDEPPDRILDLPCAEWHEWSE